MNCSADRRRGIKNYEGDREDGGRKYTIPILITLFHWEALFSNGRRGDSLCHDSYPAFIALGYDAVVGIMCSYVATQIGFWLFLDESVRLAVAQESQYSGHVGCRLSNRPLVIFTATAIIFTMRYAVKIKRTCSLPWHMKTDQYYRDDFS